MSPTPTASSSRAASRPPTAPRPRGRRPLDRVDALVGVTTRGVDSAVAVTPRQARVALAILTSRGAGDVRETVHRWLDFARKQAAPAAEVAEPDAAMVALHEWLSEWRLIARKFMTRKSHLTARCLVGKGPAQPRAREPT